MKKMISKLLAPVVLIGTLSFIMVASPITAIADQNPANCTSNTFALDISKSVSLAYDETSPFGATTITYSVSTGNPDNGSTCDVDDIDVNLTTPDGVVHNLQTAGSYPAGTATALLGTVDYLTNSVDVSGGVVTASVNANGSLHDSPIIDDPLDITKGVNVPVINPSTVVSISSSATQVAANGTVDLTVTEQNDGDVDLTNAHVDVDNGVGTLSAPPTLGDDGDGVLEPGETWSWTVSGVVVNTDTTFIATGHGTDPLSNDISAANGFPAEEDSVLVDVINPSTITTISSSVSQVIAGDTVDLTVTEQNDGDVALTSPSVVVNDGSSDIATLVAPPNSGDTNADSILDPGETWSWTVLGVAVNADTTFTATGHGTDPLLNDITYPDDLEEQDSVTVTVLNPSTITTVTSSAAMVYTGGTVDLTVTEENDGDAPLTSPSVDVDNGVGTLSNPPDSGDTNTDGILDPGETWSWTVLGVVVNADTTFTATGHGLDPLLNDITFPADQDEQDSVSVDVINPTTVTTITSSADSVLSGSSVTLTVTEENDGDVDLTGAHVDVDNGVGTLSAPPTSGDDGDGVLEPGETWSWDVDVVVNTPTTFTATGHGLDPLSNDITYPGDPEEQASVTVDVEEAQWCSPGYWRNHLDAWKATGISTDELYSAYFNPVVLSKKGQKDNAETDPTLLYVLQHPEYYGGEAFNNVGDLLSEAHPDVNFTIGDERTENCPLN
jgi:hypothetical protein